MTALKSPAQAKRSVSPLSFRRGRQVVFFSRRSIPPPLSSCNILSYPARDCSAIREFGSSKGCWGSLWQNDELPVLSFLGFELFDWAIGEVLAEVGNG